MLKTQLACLCFKLLWNVWSNLGMSTAISYADTAHPRLEVFDEGKSVKDTGIIRDVAMNSKRFDSHIFILATEGFSIGKHYWEVNVGKKNNWELGVASEAVTRKGTVILCPRNGFWVMALSDGIEYWACTDPWTRLNVRSKPQKIGILLDVSAGQLSFYDPQNSSCDFIPISPVRITWWIPGEDVLLAQEQKEIP
uniref:B30.2/SPRY domain-containing protein n=1 Tax=Phasianus colchicus TaxID=9054 RepID=A0A669QDY0_PHACC